MFRHAACAITVSYTHLDVYKRQAEEHTVCKNVFKNGDKPSAERLAKKWAELINSREGGGAARARPE